MRNKRFLIILALIIFLTSSLSYGAPYPINNGDKSKVKVTITIPNFTPPGDYIYKGVDIALYGAKIGTNSYTLFSNKAKRILTNKTNIEIDFSDTNLDYTYNYKIGYRIILGKAGIDSDRNFVAAENNGKDGWLIAKDGSADFIFKVDNENPTISDISFTGNSYKKDNNYWIKKDNEITITTKGYDKPSGIKDFYIKVGQVESSLDFETSQVRSITTDTKLTIPSGVKKELNNYYREVAWKVIGRQTSLNDIYVKYVDYAQNSSNYINTGYKLGIDGIAYKPNIKIEEITPIRKNIVLSASDNESGVKSIQYQIGNQPVQTVNSDKHNFIIDYNDYKGTVTLDIKSKTIDNVGNISGEEIITLPINFPPEITINSPKDKYEFKVLEKPTFDTTFKDQDNEKMDVKFEYNGITQTILNVNPGENLKLEIPEGDWLDLEYYKEYIFKVIATDGKSTTTKEYPLMKINTPSEIEVIKPVDGQYLYQGYINFEWDILEPDNQSYGNSILKVYTDTPNTFNNGVIYNGSVAHGKGVREAFYYLPEGIHNIFFEITDNKSEVYSKSIKVKIDTMVNININNGAKTFYIANFDEEKSNIYYSDINNRLTDSIYMFNILGKNGNLNEEYIKKIKNIVDVTSQPDYLNKGDKVYTKDGINSLKITDWILEKINKDFSINKVIKVTDMLNIESIIFEDEEKDYTSTDPNRGKNRRFQIFHIPGYYDNPDIEIEGNGEWAFDENFIKFDGQEIIKGNENISFKINKAGKYILNILEDDEIKNTHGKDFSKSSPDLDYVFYAHRPPKAVLSYEENGDGTVKLISTDSYDPDFMNLKPNKGIKKSTWEYRELTYTNDIITDWTEVPNINSFSVDSTYKTFLRLTVKDFGGLVDVDNVLPLEGSETLVFDKTGLPPKANFDINVGKALEGSIFSKNIVYKGKDGAETVQLVNKTLWNDFFATSGTRTLNYTKDATVLNNDVKNNTKTLSTTLSVINKFTLKNNITKSADVKHITIDNKTDSEIIAGSEAKINILLNSNDNISNWGDFILKISSVDLNLNNVEMNHEITNLFSVKKVLPETLTDKFDYTVSVYSKRTGELLIKQNFSTKIKMYLIISANINSKYSLNEIPIGSLIDIVGIETKCPIDVSQLEMGLYKGNELKSNTIKLSGSNKIKRVGDKISWINIKDFVIPNDLSEGTYTVKIIATAKNGEKAEWRKNIYIIDINVYGILKPNPALAGDQILFHIATEGYVDRLEIVVPNDLIAMDKRTSMGYQSIKYPILSFNVNGSIKNKEDILKYIVWVSTDKTLDKNGNQLRRPYKFIVKAYKGTAVKQIELELDINGSVLDLIKPGVNLKGN